MESTLWPIVHYVRSGPKSENFTAIGNFFVFGAAKGRKRKKEKKRKRKKKKGGKRRKEKREERKEKERRKKRRGKGGRKKNTTNPSTGIEARNCDQKCRLTMRLTLFCT